MRFQESGLPKNKLVEDAFNYSYANVMAMRPDAIRDFTLQINGAHEQALADLAEAKFRGMPEEIYKAEKENVERWRDDQLQMGPQAVEEGLKSLFRQRRLTPALEIQQHSDNAAPELLAAILLIDCVRSPVDYKNVTQKFGEGIAGLLAEVQHLDAYPSERNTNLAAAGSDTKRVYLALLITSMGQIAEQIKQMTQMNPLQKIAVPPGQEESLFSSARLLWGNDKKLDQRFFAAFNEMAEATASAFRMEVGADGAPTLMKGALTPPPPPGPGILPPGPGKNSGMGDDLL